MRGRGRGGSIAEWYDFVEPSEEGEMLRGEVGEYHHWLSLRRRRRGGRRGGSLSKRVPGADDSSGSRRSMRSPSRRCHGR